jgi:hypothetical protein
MTLDKLPDDPVDEWPEILNDVDIETIPIEYLHAIFITFQDGNVWEIDINNRDFNENTEEAARSVEDELGDLFEEFADVIDRIDFRLDTERVKNDIMKRTRTFMKKRK